MADTNPFSDIDAAGISRVLSQVADRADDLADAYFERVEEVELPASDRPGIRARSEEGLAVRLARGNRSWITARDAVDADSFSDAVRRVARAMPVAPYPRPALGSRPPLAPPHAPELVGLRSAFERSLRSHRAKLPVGEAPVRLCVRRHRRWVRVVGVQVASSTEQEQFYSAAVQTPWGNFGQLLDSAGEQAAELLASTVIRAHQARGAEPPEPGPSKIVLGAGATAVLLHEAVAHALEADILALGGHPEAAIGVEMGSPALDIFDDPKSAPMGVRRASDDEGFPTVRRCLLRRGKVEQPICDTLWSRRSDLLLPGAGRRGSRHDPPGPRSSHLELVAGEATAAELFAEADGGLYLPEAESGYLDPLTGELTLGFPYAHRIRDQAPGEQLGACRLRAHVSEILARVTAVGKEARSAGAGWCAKDGIRMPVWATCAEIGLEAIDLHPRVRRAKP